MKVYVILQWHGYEEAKVVGVFTDIKMAEKYAKKSKKDTYGYSNTIEECELDKYQRWL